MHHAIFVSQTLKHSSLRKEVGQSMWSFSKVESPERVRVTDLFGKLLFHHIWTLKYIFGTKATFFTNIYNIGQNGIVSESFKQVLEFKFSGWKNGWEGRSSKEFSRSDSLTEINNRKNQ
jgi:hypothetical protein